MWDQEWVVGSSVGWESQNTGDNELKKCQEVLPPDRELRGSAMEKMKIRADIEEEMQVCRFAPWEVGWMFQRQIFWILVLLYLFLGTL